MTLTRQRRAELYQWLADHDCDILSDIACDCDCDQAYCEHCYPVFAIRTEHDPSVGIFGQIVGPWCPSEHEALVWLDGHEHEAAKIAAAPV